MSPSHADQAVETSFRTGGCPHLAGYDPLNEEQLRNPFPIWERARREVPVFYDEANRVWGISRHEDVLQVLHDDQSFSAAGSVAVRAVPPALRDRMPEYLWAHTLVNLDPPEHTPVRKVIQAPFRPGNLRPVEPVARDIARDLIRRAKPHGGMDFPSDFAFPFSFKVLSRILGISEEDFPQILQGVNAVFAIVSGALQEEEELAYATQIADLTDWLRELVEDRRKHPGDDYCSIMIAEKDSETGKTSSNDEVAAHMFTLVASGFETTALMLADLFYTLLEERTRWEHLVADPSLAPRAVEEALRLRTAVKAVYRTTTRPVTIGGASIPAGERVALLLPSANRDSGTYSQADEYDIDREATHTHVGLGRWTHFCVGAPLARLDGRIAIETFIEEVLDLRLAEQQEITFRRDTRMYAPEHLHLVWEA